METSGLQAARARAASVAPPPPSLPIKVVFVVREMEDQANETLQVVRKFCKEKRLIVETRLYDSHAYRHDRDEIERLPAFHIFVKNMHERTFYPGGRPIQIIQQTIEEYTRWFAEKEAARGRFRRMLLRLHTALKKLLHRKTRLEKQEEFDELDKRKWHTVTIRDRLSKPSEWGE